MSKWVIVVILLMVVGGTAYYFWPRGMISPSAKQTDKQLEELKLEKYDFDNLRLRKGQAGKIEILGKIEAVEKRRNNKYNFLTREIRFDSDGKKVSGMINYWGDSKKRPVIIMIRGYAEKDGYYPGSGTWRVADELAKEGYMTISLDFLGYGNSEAESADVLEARFHKVIEVIDLIESVKQLPGVDKDRVGIWAHSNGGQIALSVLEVTGGKYPTVLWAPMTNPFPQSLIDTADEGEERQKATDFVNLFLKHYDGRRYAFENYYNWVKAPILIQQGTMDNQVKVEWQLGLQSRLVELEKPVDLIIYEGADHNLKGSWDEAVKKDMEFYNRNLKMLVY